LKADAGLADESARLATDASAGVAASVQMYADIEARLRHSGHMEGIALRYGFFYGPNTWYDLEGSAADHARRREMPIVGQGEGVWSFVHIEDAALATVAALTAPPGIYNVVDDDPSPVSRWLPAFARWVGAPPPPQLTEQEAREVAGEDAVYYGTKLSGASNAKAKQTFTSRPAVCNGCTREILTARTSAGETLWPLGIGHEHLIRIGALLESGDLRPVVDAVLPLPQASAAYTGDVRPRRGAGSWWSPSPHQRSRGQR
jgi:hypothetical protein